MGSGCSWETPLAAEAAAALGISESPNSDDSMHVQDELVKELLRTEKGRAQNRKAQQSFRARKRQELEQVKETLRQKEATLIKLERAYRQLYIICTALKRSEGRTTSPSTSVSGRCPLQRQPSRSHPSLPDEIPITTLDRFGSGTSQSPTSSTTIESSLSRPGSDTTVSSMFEEYCATPDQMFSELDRSL